MPFKMVSAVSYTLPAIVTPIPTISQFFLFSTCCVAVWLTHLGCRLQVTFSLPSYMYNQSLLYSGLIRLKPRKAFLPAVVIPYQGYTQQWSAVRLLAKPDYKLDRKTAASLRRRQNSICYSPYSQVCHAWPPSADCAIDHWLGKVIDPFLGTYCS